MRHHVNVYYVFFEVITVRVAVIHTSTYPTTHSRELLKELRSRGVEAHYIPLPYVTVRFSTGSFRFSIRGRQIELDGALLRGVWRHEITDKVMFRVGLLAHMELSGVRLMNRLVPFLICKNKHLSLAILASHGIGVPDTVVTEDVEEAYRLVKEIGDVVVKPIYGSRGYGAFRVNDPDVAYQVMRVLASLNLPIYIQRFVEKPGRDIRVFVVGERVVAAMYRVSRNWKTNVAQGAKGEPAKLDPELEELAIKAVKALKLDYAGIDIGESRDGPVVFEVNSSPMWAELKRVTGVNIPGEIVDYFLTQLRR